MSNFTARTEDPAEYRVNATPAATDDDAIIQRALAILDSRLRKPGAPFDCPDDVKAYCCLHIGTLPHEVFGVLFCDTQNKLIAYEQMFRGSLTQTSVYPREVVIQALHHQASAVVFAHNHPSGSVQPSRADVMLTQTLKTVLALVDVRVLDHVIVSGSTSLSMAEKGLL